ncbi:MAG: phosphatase PAP2 family protein, partial [Candidatus Binataceae bacterium]
MYLAHTALGSLDPAIARYIEAHRVHWMVHLMWRITLLGSPWFTLEVAVAGGLAMRMLARSWRALTLLVLAYAGAIILEIALKLTVARPRPPAAWMAVIVSGVSFPSGHAARAAALYGMLACVIAELHGNWRRQLWITAALLALLVGTSRVYLGVHWATDVIGGWIIGAAWLWVVI